MITLDMIYDCSLKDCLSRVWGDRESITVLEILDLVHHPLNACATLEQFCTPKTLDLAMHLIMKHAIKKMPLDVKKWAEKWPNVSIEETKDLMSHWKKANGVKIFPVLSAACERDLKEVIRGLYYSKCLSPEELIACCKEALNTEG